MNIYKHETIINDKENYFRGQENLNNRRHFFFLWFISV